MSARETQRALTKHITALNALLARVRLEHPAACFCLVDATMHLLSGPSHEGGGLSRPERSIASARLNYPGGGDW